MKIIIAGGTGFIGSAVVEQLLSQGHEVAVLSRHSSQAVSKRNPKAAIIPWDGKTLGAWCSVLEGAIAIINFSGANINARRWNGEYKRILRESRIGPTQLIVRAIAACANPPRVFINASAVGYYGDAGDSLLTEESPGGREFLAELCFEWEKAACEAQKCGVRVIMLRMGIVLGCDGVLKKFIAPFRLYVGGALGSGRQWLSWVSIKELGEIILFLLRDNTIEGPVNCVSPCPLTMNDFCCAIGLKLNRPSWLRSPACVIRLALGQMAEVVLSSQRAVPQKLLEAGFRFQNPDVNDVLTEILQK